MNLPAFTREHVTLTPAAQAAYDAWRAKVRELEQGPRPAVVPTATRYLIDQPHPYGWDVCVQVSLRWPDGRTSRVSRSALGTDRVAAINNALTCADWKVIQSHPDAAALFDTYVRVRRS